MLKTLYPYLTHRNIKNRFTRTQNQIKSQLEEEANHESTCDIDDYDSTVEY